MVEMQRRANLPGCGEGNGMWNNVINTLCKTENHSRTVAASWRASQKDQEESWISLGFVQEKYKRQCILRTTRIPPL